MDQNIHMMWPGQGQSGFFCEPAETSRFAWEYEMLTSKQTKLHWRLEKNPKSWRHYLLQIMEASSASWDYAVRSQWPFWSVLGNLHSAFAKDFKHQLLVIRGTRMLYQKVWFASLILSSSQRYLGFFHRQSRIRKAYHCTTNYAICKGSNGILSLSKKT